MSDDHPVWRRRDLLPGPTAYQLAGWVLASLGVGAFGAVGALIWGFALAPRTTAWDLLGVVMITMFAGGGLAAFVFDRWSNSKTKKEIAAGFTTKVNGNNQVECVHSRTGVVIREAGEPNLTREQWEAAMNRVRAYEASIASSNQ